MAFVLLHCCIMLYKIAQMQCIEKHKGRKKLPSAQPFRGEKSRFLPHLYIPFSVPPFLNMSHSDAFPLMEIYEFAQMPVAFKTFGSHKWDSNSFHNVYWGLELVQAVWTLILLMCHQRIQTDSHLSLRDTSEEKRESQEERQKSEWGLGGFCAEILPWLGVEYGAN